LNKINYILPDGKKMRPLTDMLKHKIVKLSEAVKANVNFMIDLRNEIEHKANYAVSGDVFVRLQANCLNFNNVIKDWFGEVNCLDSIYPVALQFAKISLDQSKTLVNSSATKEIDTFISKFEKGISPDILDSEEYQFTITFALINENKAKNADAVRFIVPGSEGYEETKNILIKRVFISDDRYKYLISGIEALLKKKKKSITRHDILVFIKDKKLRDIKNKISNNPVLVKPFMAGQKTIIWRYTEEFLQLCYKELIC
jgi:hypothetical protein